MYLGAALDVFASGEFCYTRELMGEHDAMLEFNADIKGVLVNGVDMIRWNDEGKITEFKVMIRPLKAVNILHQEMAAKLQVTTIQELVDVFREKIGEKEVAQLTE